MTPLPASPFVVRADIVQAHASAAAIRDDAVAQAAAILERAREQRRDAVAAGHAEGLRTGAAQVAQLAAAAATSIDVFLDERAVELQELAFAIAHRMLASLPHDECLACLAAEAIAEHRLDVRLTLRVSDGDAGPLRAALAEADPHGRVAVVGDPAAEPGSCTLIHSRGRTRIGLLEQFRALIATAS